MPNILFYNWQDIRYKTIVDWSDESTTGDPQGITKDKTIESIVNDIAFNRNIAKRLK